MPDRTLETIAKELQAKQEEISEITDAGQFRETVDNIDVDLDAVREFVDATASGIEEAGESIGENFDQLSNASEGFKEVLEGVQGGLESTSNVLGKVKEGLDKLDKALEAVKKIDDLRTTDGSEALENFAEAFEMVVDELGPLVDAIPGLGAFLQLYAAGIRNIAESAKVLEARIASDNEIYKKINPGKPLFITQEWLAHQKLVRLQGEYDELFEEAMDAAADEREARNAPPTGPQTPSKADIVVRAATKRCDSLLPADNSDEFRKWLKAKFELQDAEDNASQARGALEVIELSGEGDAARAQHNIEKADAKLEAARETFKKDGAEYSEAMDAYNDCVKSHIYSFAGYEHLDENDFRMIAIDHPAWDVRGWKPTVTQKVTSNRCAARDTVVAVIGGALLAGGLFVMATAGTGATPGVAAQVSGAAGVAASSVPWEPAVLVSDTIGQLDPEPDTSVTSDTQAVQVAPGIDSFCSGTDHYPSVPATDGDGNTTRSLSKQVIGAYFTGLPEGTRITMEVARIGSTVGVVDSDGYAEFQLPLNSYGTYEITSVVADLDGTPVVYDPVDLGTKFRVGDAEQACGQSTLTAPTTTTTTTTTSTTTTTLAPTSTLVAAGGGAIAIPETFSGGNDAVVISAGSPGTPGSGADAGNVAIAVGLLVFGTALLGGLGAKGMGCDEN